MPFYADELYSCPGYYFYLDPRSVDTLGGQKIHLRGRIRPIQVPPALEANRNSMFLLEQPDGKQWAVCFALFRHPIPYGETVDLYGTFLCCQPDLNLPLVEMISCGGIRRENGEVLRDAMAAIVDRLMCFDPPPEEEENGTPKEDGSDLLEVDEQEFDFDPSDIDELLKDIDED